MNKIKFFTTEHPLIFGLATTIVFIVMVLVSSILSARWPAETPGWYIIGTIGRVISIILFLLILSRQGWLESAGFTRLGGWQVWLILLPLLAYSIVVSAFVITGNLRFGFSKTALTWFAVVFLMAHAFLEEAAFRGLILHGLVRAWEGTSRGLVKSVLVSSLFFGGYHILYLAGEPLPVVLSRMVFSTLLGFFLGAIVLKAGSIYPAVFFHGILNLAGYLSLSSNGVEGTASSWLWMSLFMLPLALWGLFSLPNRSMPNEQTAHVKIKQDVTR